MKSSVGDDPGQQCKENIDNKGEGEQPGDREEKKKRGKNKFNVFIYSTIAACEKRDRGEKKNCIEGGCDAAEKTIVASFEQFHKASTAKTQKKSVESSRRKKGSNESSRGSRKSAREPLGVTFAVRRAGLGDVLRGRAGQNVGEGGVRGLGTVKEGAITSSGGGRGRRHGTGAVKVIASRSQTLEAGARGRSVLRGDLFASTEARTNLDAKIVDAGRALGTQAAAAATGAARMAGGAYVR